MFHHRRESKRELEEAKSEKRLSSHLLRKANTTVLEPLRKIDRENNFGELVDSLLYGRKLNGAAHKNLLH